jgi:hypothetical protein
MADPRHIAPAVHPAADAAGSHETGALLTQADFDALVRELEALRTKHRGELAERLREARAFGSSTEDDDLLFGCRRVRRRPGANRAARGVRAPDVRR